MISLNYLIVQIFNIISSISQKNKKSDIQHYIKYITEKKEALPLTVLFIFISTGLIMD